ncbi:MAG: hypothetical protein JWM81_386 [Candidatus Saccharibacteria bacterium]|nr:hypothetical protein [Candidatus Saccharibacteria bacterium]
MGFASHEMPRVGAASVMNGRTVGGPASRAIQGPSVGFYADMASTYDLSPEGGWVEKQKVKPVSRAKRQHSRDRSEPAPYYPWPAMRIGRPLAKKIPSRINNFHTELSRRVAPLEGVTAIPLRDVMVEYVPRHAIVAALNERYTKVAKGPDRAAQKRAARAFTCGINDIISTMGQNHGYATLSLLAEDRQAAPDVPTSLRFDAKDDELLRSASLWQPGDFYPGETEAVGTHGLGFVITEAGAMHIERDELVGRMCSHFRLNPAHFLQEEDEETQFEVAFVTLDPRSKAKMPPSSILPAAPYPIAFHSPRADMLMAA